MCENGVLIVQIVVEEGDSWRGKRELLCEGTRGADVKLAGRGRTVEIYFCGSLLRTLCRPLVVDGCAVRPQHESARNMSCALLGLDFRGAVSNPIGSIRSDLEFFFADLLSVHRDAKNSLVRLECRRIGGSRSSPRQRRRA